MCVFVFVYACVCVEREKRERKGSFRAWGPYRKALEIRCLWVQKGGLALSLQGWGRQRCWKMGFTFFIPGNLNIYLSKLTSKLSYTIKYLYYLQSNRITEQVEWNFRKWHFVSEKNDFKNLPDTRVFCLLSHLLSICNL